jgi:hypothetical protein
MFKAPFKATLIATALVFSGLTVAAETFEIEHLPLVKNSGNITVSPDGSISAYTLSNPRDMVVGDEDGTADTHLYVMSSKGKAKNQSVRFIGNKGSVSALHFSADSETLFFKTKREDDENTSLYSISLNVVKLKNVLNTKLLLATMLYPKTVKPYSLLHVKKTHLKISKRKVLKPMYMRKKNA